MFAIPGILLFVTIVYARPQELFALLRPVPLLPLAIGLALFGWLVDLRLRKTRPAFAPADGAVVAFYAWALLTAGMRRPYALLLDALQLLAPLVGYFLVAHAVQTFRALAVVGGTIVALVLWLGVVGVHQGAANFGCHVVDAQALDGAAAWDGRRCDTRRDCEEGDVDPTAEYVCEKIGLVGTSSIGGGRVRYRGPLGEPDALAMVMALGLPLAFAVGGRGRGWVRRGLLRVAALGLAGGCVAYTGSRGGMVAVVAVIATYSIARFGGKGILAAALLAPLGWLAPAAAPVARNSYAHVVDDLGWVGFVAWAAILYISAKVTIVALRRYAGDASAEVARRWALALLAALVALVAGMFYTSFAYDRVLWLLVGMCGALYGACRAHDPEFRVGWGWRDLWQRA